MSGAAATGMALKKALRLGGTLFLVTAITGLVLGVVEQGTREAILRTRGEARSEALRNVMPEAETFKSLEVAPEEGPVAVVGVDEALRGSDREGWCVAVSSKGYGGPVSLMVGITKDGGVRALRVLTHSETPGLGARSAEPAFHGQFDNRSRLPLRVVKGAAGAEDEVSAISGATITSTAVVAGVNAAVDYWNRNLQGGQKQ